jgi:predicted small lipoprotein YifL
MLRTIKATVATMMVLALAACGSVTGPDLDKSPAGYDGNGPQTSPDELAPGSGDEGGGGQSGNDVGQAATQRNRHARPHEVAPGSDQEGGGSEGYFDPAPPVEDDEEHDPEGGEYTPTDDGDGM